MGVVHVTDMRIRELAVEGLLRGQFGLGEAIPGVHVLVWVHTLANDQFALCLVCLVLCCDLESLRPVRRHQSVEQELGAVNEA